MPAKSKKKGHEDMLLRVIRVAEILAKGEADTAIETDQKTQAVVRTDRGQKTQAQRFNVS